MLRFLLLAFAFLNFDFSTDVVSIESNRFYIKSTKEALAEGNLAIRKRLLDTFKKTAKEARKICIHTEVVVRRTISESSLMFLNANRRAGDLEIALLEISEETTT